MAFDSTLKNILGQYSAIVITEPDRALQILLDYQSTYANEPLYLQSLGEAYLEINDVETAYNVLKKACELDQQAQNGVEKFLHLGQIIGGTDGVNLLEIGIAELIRELEMINQQQEPSIDNDNIQILIEAYQTPEKIVEYLIVKLTGAIAALIEIWMTDLCMEPQAESECEKWCNVLLDTSNGNGQTHSLVASVRISQQKFDDATEEINIAWQMFQEKKEKLEQLANDSSISNQDTSDSEAEYLELHDQLLALSKHAFECGLFSLASDISTAAREINEDSVDAAYLEGFSNYLEAIRLQENIAESDSWKISREFEQYTLQPPTPSSIEAELVSNSQLALSAAVKSLYNKDIADNCDPELQNTIHALLEKVGGFLAREPKIDVSQDELLDSLEN